MSSYEERLKAHLQTLLTPIFPTTAERSKYLDHSVMNIWKQAFTHETFDAMRNYERLETLGDALLKSVFIRYLMTRYPTLPSSMITELNIAYMSKKFQAELSEAMQLSSFLRAPSGVIAPLGVREDLFESFFGALSTVSEKIFPGVGVGIGYINCYNYIIYLFDRIPIDLKEGLGPPKTQVLQIFARFELPKPVELIDNISIPSQAIAALRLEPANMEFLARYNVNLDSNIIAKAQGSTEKVAFDEAYLRALQVLESYGINTEWAEIEKNRLDMNDPAVQPYLQAAEDKARRAGFIRIVFSTPASIASKTLSVLQLIGVRDDYSRQILGTEVLRFHSSEDRAAQTRKIVEARAKLMSTYATT